MTSKPVVVGANVEKLVENNQLLTNVNNLIQPSTISRCKVFEVSGLVIHHLSCFLNIPSPMTKNAYVGLS